ncbi:MAG: flavoprotein family/uncharacterized flavoprotein family [Bacteroidetes bacterium]|nr:flavoprotein family/uncharacterized flavoprotein family [Bacteroidota bacterium]
MPMKNPEKRSVAIIGGGAAALMLAATLDENLFDVSIYEKNHAVGRKFLVAGDGGFNLTHSEELDEFVKRYTPVAFLEKSLRSFTNEHLREWLKGIGIETYVGSSKRVFPVKGIKPIEVLQAFLEVLKKKNVKINTQHEWKGWKNDALLFNEDVIVKADITVFALGGASWKVTGSDGAWTELFKEKEIRTVPFQPSNCAYQISWNPEFIIAAEGLPLKNIVIRCDDKERLGEVVITSTGIEGGAIYALSAPIRKQLNEKGAAKVLIDLKPGITVQQIKDKFSKRGNRSIKKLLEDRLGFTDATIGLLKSALTKEQFTDLGLLAEKIKNLPLKITGMAEMDEAISTVGGVTLREVDENFQLIRMPNNYVIGEMLNWDAPTGGYLLQACFSMGWALGERLNSKNTF